MTNAMITILGPTASGKTALAARLAAATEGEIISADSRQVYKEMDIGTGKDLDDYVINGRNIPYHLINICEPGTKYDLFRYLQDARKAYDDILSRGSFPILCGGTGLYIEAFLKDYRLSPVPRNEALRSRLEGKSLSELTEILKSLKAQNGRHMHNQTDVDTARRAIRAIEIEVAEQENAGKEPSDKARFADRQPLIVGINIDRESRRENITKRLQQRLEGGMIDEIRRLLAKGIAPEDLTYYGLEYKYVTEHVLGKTGYDEMFRLLETAIHQFAKRQMTWFRGMERRGFVIHWIDAALPMDEKLSAVMQLMNH